MDELTKWKRFSIPMSIAGIIGAMEIVISHNYFGILGVIAFAGYLLYYNTGKNKIKLNMDKINKSTYLYIENIQFKFLFLSAISYIFIVTVIALMLKNYDITIMLYTVGIIVFSLIYLLYIKKIKNIIP